MGQQASTTTTLKLVTLDPTTVPAKFCQQQSFTPWVSEVLTNGLQSNNLVCATSLSLSISNYQPYQFGQYSPYLSKRMLFTAADYSGATVDIFQIDRFCIVPQDFKILQIISVQSPLPSIPLDSTGKPQQSYLQMQMDNARTAGKNIFGTVYALKVQDPNGNQHFITQIDKYVSGQRAANFSATMLPIYGTNLMLQDAISITGISAYSILEVSTVYNAFSLKQGTQYQLSSNGKFQGVSDSGFVGGILNMFDSTKQQLPPKSVVAPFGMSVIGFGCTDDCQMPVVIFGYKNELESLLYYQSNNGVPAIKYATQKYLKADVLAYLIQMFYWAYDVGLMQYTPNQSAIINNMIGVIISGQYGLYADPILFQGKLDEYMGVFCSDKGKLLPLCSCYNTNTQTPLCSDRVCQVHGYKSQRVLSQNCDPYNNMDTIKGYISTSEQVHQQSIKQLQTDQSNIAMTIAQLSKDSTAAKDEIVNQSKQISDKTIQKMMEQNANTVTQTTQMAADMKNSQSLTLQAQQKALDAQNAQLQGLTTDMKSSQNLILQTQQKAFDTQNTQLQGFTADMKNNQNLALQAQQKALESQSAQLLANQQQNQQILNGMIQESQKTINQALTQSAQNMATINQQTSSINTSISAVDSSIQKTNNVVNTINGLIQQFGEQQQKYQQLLLNLDNSSASSIKTVSQILDSQTREHKFLRYLLLFLVIIVCATTAICLYSAKMLKKNQQSNPSQERKKPGE